MSVDLHRDYASLETLSAAARHDPRLVLGWAERRCEALAAAERRHDYLQDAWSGWGNTFVLAVLYGWAPAWTPHEHPSWEGGYLSNDGARVTDGDARAFANALERALSDPDREHSPSEARTSAIAPDLADLCQNARAALAQLSDAEGRGRLRQYVRFLQRGGFTIQ